MSKKQNKKGTGEQVIQMSQVLHWMHDMTLNQSLNAGAIRTGSILAKSLSRKTGQCNPSINLIADQSGQSKRTVIRSIQSLEECGLVRCEKGGAGRGDSSVYILIDSSGSDINGFFIKGDSRVTHNNANKGDTHDTHKDELRVTDLSPKENDKGDNCDHLRVTSVTNKGDKPCTTSNERNRGIEPGYRTGVKRSSNTELEITTQTTKQKITAAFAELHFEIAKVHNPTTMGMISRWADLGVTREDVLDVVSGIRARDPTRGYSPTYFDKPMTDYLEAKRNGTHSKTTRQNDSYSDRLDRAEAILVERAETRTSENRQTAVLGDAIELPAIVGSVVSR